MARVRWSDQAANDLDDILDYIGEFNTTAAAKIGQRLKQLGESLATASRRGRPVAGGLRELTAASPYILRYEIVDDEVHILLIRHSRRRPLA